MEREDFKVKIKEDVDPTKALMERLLLEKTRAAASRNRPESRSARASLLLTPTTKRNIEKLAVLDCTSVNDLINIVMEEYVKGRTDDIQKYNDLYYS